MVSMRSRGALLAATALLGGGGLIAAAPAAPPPRLPSTTPSRPRQRP
jgi:hypothetical protein